MLSAARDEQPGRQRGNCNQAVYFHWKLRVSLKRSRRTCSGGPIWNQRSLRLPRRLPPPTSIFSFVTIYSSSGVKPLPLDLRQSSDCRNGAIPRSSFRDNRSPFQVKAVDPTPSDVTSRQCSGPLLSDRLKCL